MDMEYLNTYDNYKNRLDKKIDRGTMLNKDEHILISILFIRNSDGKYLIQKTSQEKGGLYSSTGGHVLYNENSLDAIKRECKEELGLYIDEHELNYIGTLLINVPFFDIYYLESDININSLKLQREEVDDIIWLTKDEIYNLIDNNLFTKSHGIIFKNIIDKK